MAGTTATATEVRLLWAASCPEPPLDEVRAALDDGADLEVVATHAFVNRVGPLVWRTLGLLGEQHRAGPAGELLERDTSLRRVQHALLVPTALARVVEPLQSVGIEPLVFKGPAIAARYPDPGLRPMDDIDVIVAAAEHRRALTALEAAGWQPIEDRLGDEHYDTYLVHPDVPDLPVELHWELNVWRERTNGVRATTLLAHRRPATLAGVEVGTLPPELELVALAAHAGKPFHHFNRLIWFVDVAVAVGDGRSLDWAEVDRLARRLRCQTVLAVALRHARRLGAVVPEELTRLPRNRLRRAALEPALEAQWPLTVPDDGTLHRLNYALTDSRVRSAALLVGEITKGASPRDIPGRVWVAGRGASRRLLRGIDSPERGTSSHEDRRPQPSDAPELPRPTSPGCTSERG